MYMPENNDQMYDILSELRVYAAMNNLSALAEKLDDALVLLRAESRKSGEQPRPISLGRDSR